MIPAADASRRASGRARSLFQSAAAMGKSPRIRCLTDALPRIYDNLIGTKYVLFGESAGFPDGSKGGLRMDLDRLREFARIAECGSVSAAARRLGLSVATLSARLRGLEKSLGTSLFDREGRALILTDAGRCLLGNSREILSRYASVADELRSLKEHRYDRLTLAADAPFPLHLGPLLDRLNAANPELQLRLIIAGEISPFDALLDGSLDVFFATGPEDPVPEGIARRQIAGATQRVILPAVHPLAGRSVLTLKELEGECFLLYPDSPGSTARAFQLRNLEASGIRYTVCDSGTSRELLQFLVPMGKGLLLTPYHLVDIPASVEIPLTEVPFPACPWLYTAAEPIRPEVIRFVRDFFDFVRKSAGGEEAQA